MPWIAIARERKGVELDIPQFSPPGDFPSSLASPLVRAPCYDDLPSRVHRRLDGGFDIRVVLWPNAIVIIGGQVLGLGSPVGEDVDHLNSAEPFAPGEAHAALDGRVVFDVIRR
jgi:hypothetical protein